MHAAPGSRQAVHTHQARSAQAAGAWPCGGCGACRAHIGCRGCAIGGVSTAHANPAQRSSAAIYPASNEKGLHMMNLT
eukprot:1324482-Alexandrium_andersonii.AAC.1